MHVTPTPNGALLVNDPPNDLRYDVGNRRLFATLDGAGNISLFRLPEGIAILNDWQNTARLDGVPVRWHEAEAIGRSWTLRGTALDVRISLRTACDADTPALVQVWTVENTGQSERIFTLSLDVTFDLLQPAIQIGQSATNAQLHGLVRDNPVIRRVLGARRWRVLNRISETQKRMKPVSRRAVVDIEALSDGIRARGDSSATLRAGAPPAGWQAHANGGTLHYRAVLNPGDTYRLPVIVAAGDSANPVRYRHTLTNADAYAGWLASTFESDDALLRSLYVASLNVALSMYKELPSGFSGLWAGPNYAYPPRIYFRDGYWTALVILPYHPEWVREHLLVLAAGVHADGTCPSGVIDLTVLPFEDQDHAAAADWLPDHQDSPAFFVLLLYEYIAWTGDTSLLHEHTPDGRTMWECAQACLNRLIANPAKSRAPNDWADNVLRSEWVTYDLALLYGALDAAADLARHTGERDTAATYAQDRHHVGTLIQIHGWDEGKGHYIDYRRTGEAEGQAFVEDHLALDSLLALLFGAASEEQSHQMMAAAREQLQTRHNTGQPHGDWGIMCCWPPYSLRADLFAKSAQPYNYHNGAEWPYLSAVYAQLLMEHGDPDWSYALTRWWQIQLDNGWLTPVEYHSPAHPPGAFLQGWSGMAVSAMLVGGLGLRPALNGAITLRVPPWGESTFHNLIVRGKKRTVIVSGDAVKLG
ncbi:MAG: hypothetical protein JXJ20_12110 [Anaerolineae bacterium]|nr:hypothetical protein [Anaerolineae bacterium]